MTTLSPEDELLLAKLFAYALCGDSPRNNAEKRRQENESSRNASTRSMLYSRKKSASIS